LGKIWQENESAPGFNIANRTQTEGCLQNNLEQRKPDGSRLVRCPERSAVASHRPENHNITLAVSE
jgi:hypothetical protein